MSYSTATETYFDRLRKLLRDHGYDKDHAAIQSLARLRKSLRQAGYTFDKAEASNV